MLRSARRTFWACASALMIVVMGAAGASAAGLSDGRAYELVSPPAKLGADVAVDSQRTRIAVDGNAASFASLRGFGDVRGTGQATEYVSQRSEDSDPGTNGWATHAITPPQDPLSLFAAFQGLDSAWAGEFSADLSKGVFNAWSPLSNEDPNILNVENLYLRDDLRTAGAGSYQLLTRCPACSSPFPPFNVLRKPSFAGASSDFSHLIFESALPLTPDSSGGDHLYEYANGTLRLAGILPDGACGTPPCVAPTSVAGHGASATLAPNVISPDGSRIIFTDTSAGQIYERIDGNQTLTISASERTDCADVNPCTGAAAPDPGGPQEAIYQTATADHARVLFTTAEQMTDDDTNTIIDLYQWDATASAGHHLTRLSVDSNPLHGFEGVIGVIGASANGDYVYFVAAGQLLPNKPSTTRGIYVWHRGATPSLSYVGELAAYAFDNALDLLGVPSLGGGIRARVTPDGQKMLFVSRSGRGLISAHGGVDYDQTGCSDGCIEFYLYNADSGSLACVSCNPSGAPATASADNRIRIGTLSSALHLSHPLTDDGRLVFFSSAEALTPEDVNGKPDAYEYHTQTGEIDLISSGTDSEGSYFMDATPDGNDVFLATRQRLVGWDTDSNYDLYDARVGGGFPDPPAPAPTCAGDPCQGPLNTAPGAPALGSTVASGDGNVKSVVKPTVKRKPAPKKCKRGYARKKVKGKVRCVKKRTAKKSKQASARRRTR